MNKATKTKAMQGIRKFLEMRGFEIVEDGWKSGKNRIDFVARDEDDLVFVDCHVHGDTGEGFPADAPDRATSERVAAAYLAQHDGLEQTMIRFDIVSMLVLSNDRAMVRHYRNALSVA